ncbi:MAG: 3-hydroxybutyryl-CoA dehydrogenase [Geothrix sp.]|uniref:3-hydroxyacyl-CoA dehydrogenase family protein n=1 Tax=Geothrix sp. TaxID=1962974 RepID=UPI0017D82DA5|nr:3-hydroxyacyl-CoA dehydrogenase NAD-binding domain-containing protein [Geothrix sp.]NWJ39882.1 3-hydroxybutyryl-CoA dehydrogenase [Geothrix sp.]WIL22105.1 MAG: 3-hydroxyacyl-CoA dehydrogenase NAD-binding domain-containing protein [Geothrix sp.]
MSATLAILGPGVLGLSTAQWAAECGLETRLLGRDRGHAEVGLREIHRRWDRAISKDRMSPETRDRCMERLSAAAFCASALEGASAFLEALPEAPDLKAPALSAASTWGSPELLVLAGTSALPITDLARRAGVMGRLVGFHLFVPVPRMAVVEMAVPEGTLPSWVDRARSLGADLRKRVVQVRDQPGFAAARMALAQGLEAIRLVESGVASAEDLDALMTLGYGHPVGPLELSDRIGLDLRLRIAEGLLASGEERFQPPGLLQAKVAAGHTGLKGGQGFHAWTATRRRS